MKKKENLWQLLKRLDEEAGQFNMAISEANRYFDHTEKKTKKLLQQHERDLHKTISKVKSALKIFTGTFGLLQHSLLSCCCLVRSLFVPASENRQQIPKKERRRYEANRKEVAA